MSLLEWFLMPSAPGATVSLLLISLAVSLTFSLANRLLVNQEQLMEWRREFKEWNSKLNEAKRSGNKKLLAKLKKKEPQMLKLQSKMTFQSLKVSFIFMIPLLILWQVLYSIYPSPHIAFLPGFGWLNVYWWYFLSYSFFGFMFSRLFTPSMRVE